MVQQLTAEQHRLQRATSQRVRQRIQAHVTWLTRELARVDRDLDQALQASPLSGRLAAPGAWGRAGADTHPAGRAAGTRHLVPPAGGDLGGGGAAESGQWHLARAAQHVGWPAGRAGRPVHGSADGHALPGADPGVLPAAVSGRQSEESGPGGLYAEAADDPECDAAGPGAVAASGRRHGLTVNTVAPPC